MEPPKEKSKAVRIMHSTPPEIKIHPETTKLLHNPKTFKIVRLARMRHKPSTEALTSPVEEDFELESSGNISNFFLEKNPITGIYEPPEYEAHASRSKSNIRLNFVGPSSIMEKKTPVNLDKKSTRLRKTSEDLKEAPSEPGIPLLTRLEQIEDDHNKEKRLEKEKFRNMSIGERIVHTRQGKILEKFRHTERDWKSIEQNLAKTVKKEPEDLAVNRAYEYREKIEQWDILDRQIGSKEKAADNAWYMSLRESPSRGALETHLPVGYNFNRIYARIPERTKSVEPIIKRPGGLKTNGKTFKESNYFLQRITANTVDNSIAPDLDVNELQVIGVNKFEMELECAEMGNSSVEAPREEEYEEEVIEEYYDPILKY